MDTTVSKTACLTETSDRNHAPGSLMSAAVLERPRHFAVQACPIPEPGAGQVLVKLEGCGVCASNLVPWTGPDWMQFPTEAGGLGHEGWGTIVDLGKGVDEKLRSQRVAALSQHSYAQYDLADESAVVPLPATLDGIAFPGEPLGCAMNIFRRSNIGEGDTVAIVGTGFMGALLTQLAAAAGANVIAISRRLPALTMAKQFGANRVVLMDDHARVIEAVSNATGGKFCPRVIELTGAQWPLDLAAELTAERGRLIVAGYHQDGPRQVNMQLWNWRGIDVVNAHERDPMRYTEGVRDALDAVLTGRLNPTALYTHTYDLWDINQAFHDACDKPDTFMKALIRFPS